MSVPLSPSLLLLLVPSHDPKTSVTTSFSTVADSVLLQSISLSHNHDKFTSPSSSFIQPITSHMSTVTTSTSEWMVLSHWCLGEPQVAVHCLVHLHHVHPPWWGTLCLSLTTVCRRTSLFLFGWRYKSNRLVWREYRAAMLSHCEAWGANCWIWGCVL